MSKWDGKTHAQRFRERVQVNQATGCWDWTSTLNCYGYAVISVNNSTIPAGRWWWQKVNKRRLGRLEFMHHICENPRCVNPKHLIVVTPKEHLYMHGNSFPAINAKKTKCPRGHPYSGENLTYNNLGKRVCRACEKARLRRAYLKKKGL